MRWIIVLLATAIAGSCNTSGKKDPGASAADTAANKAPAPLQKMEPVKGTAADIPAGIGIKGTAEEVWKWTDEAGENLLITSRVAPYDDKEKNEYGEEGQTAELAAALFVKKEGKYQPVWSWNEKEKSCPFDITCAFIKDAVSITDLDADGLAETTLQYRLACRSDVSPSVMKLVMQEGPSKYILKGLMWLKVSPEDRFTVTEKDANLETLPGYKGTDEEYMKTFGRYESEKSFANAPPEFLSHARNRWMRFVIETTE